MTGIIRTKRRSLSCYLAVALLVRHVMLQGPSPVRSSTLKEEKERGGEGAVNTFKIVYLIFFVISGRDAS